MRDEKGRFIKGAISERRNGKDLKCKLCYRVVYVPKYRLKTFGFCSVSCSARFNYEKLAPKMIQGAKNRIYHQNDCSCFRCRSMKGEDHYNWRGGRQKHGDGYIQLYKPDHPSSDKRGRIMEHRYVMEVYLGRVLDKDEHIHHLNGDKTDNRIENLKIMSNKEHLELHWGGQILILLKMLEKLNLRSEIVYEG